MTKETFVRTVKGILLQSAEIRWNSVYESQLASLGRSFEAGTMDGEAVIEKLKEILGFVFGKDMQKKVMKALR